MKVGMVLISHCGDNWGGWGGGGDSESLFTPTLSSIFDSLSSPPVWPR